MCIQQLVGCKNCDRSIFDFIVTFELFYMLLLELTNKWPLLREYQLSCYLHLNSEYISIFTGSYSYIFVRLQLLLLYRFAQNYEFQ